jgi:colicin import membrane protein
MGERKSDRWISITQSVLLHGALVGALAYGFYTYKQLPRPAPTLAVEGSIVQEKDLRAPQSKVEKPAPAPEPVKPPPPEPAEDVGPPTPTPEDTQKREQEERDAADAQQKKLDEQRKAVEEQQAQERKAADAKAVAEQKARAEADEKKRQQDQRDAEAKRVAEAKKRADDKRKAEEDKRRQDEARVRADTEAELRKNLEQEEHANAIRSSGALASWVGQIANRIQRAWLRPPSARPGIDCQVFVTQIPGGEVTDVRIGTCNGDAAVRESIESAVRRASPLPPPPDPSLFERNLEIRFVPVD